MAETKPSQDNSIPLPDSLYDEHYYARSLPGLEHLDNENLIDEAAPETVRIGAIQPADRVLDFGCGRGALCVALARYGCEVVGVDFSAEAIRFAEKLKKRFPAAVQKKIRFDCRKIEELSFQGEFDVIVLNQVYEHLHDWQLKILFAKLKRALKKGGVLVISTPNLNYLRFLYPVKRLVNLPAKMVKETIRLLRGKSRHAASPKAFFREIFKIRYPESEHTKLHINLQTPHSLGLFLSGQGLSAEIQCVDRHKNLIGLALRPWWGETLWARCYFK